MERKTISVMIPTYNEEENIREISAAVIETLTTQFPQYDYELLIIDNKSQDKTREYISAMCAENKNIKAIFNAKNCGQFSSPYHGMLQTTGDCTITMCADFQDPVELLPTLIHKWEEGYKIVCAVKTASEENPVIYFIRSLYYKFMHRFGSSPMIEHFTGFGLYDKSFLDVLRDLRDPIPFQRAIVAELGFDIAFVEYKQAKRRAGKTHNNMSSLYDAAMLSITGYTKVALRLPAIIGSAIAGFSVLGGIIYLIAYLVNHFTVGLGPVILLICFFGGLNLFFIGMVGEYVLGINERVKNRPLVVEERRLNFTDEG